MKSKKPMSEATKKKLSRIWAQKRKDKEAKSAEKGTHISLDSIPDTPPKALYRTVKGTERVMGVEVPAGSRVIVFVGGVKLEVRAVK